MPEPPQFDAPFRLDSTGQVVVCDQQSDEDIAAQVYNVLVCPQGAKLDDPKFGMPFELFGPVPIADSTALLRALQRLIPRVVKVTADESAGIQVSTRDVALTVQIEER